MIKAAKEMAKVCKWTESQYVGSLKWQSVYCNDNCFYWDKIMVSGALHYHNSMIKAAKEMAKVCKWTESQFIVLTNVCIGTKSKLVGPCIIMVSMIKAAKEMAKVFKWTESHFVGSLKWQSVYCNDNCLYWEKIMVSGALHYHNSMIMAAKEIAKGL